MGFHDFSCYSPMQARPDLELSGPSGILAQDMEYCFESVPVNP